MQRHQNRFSTPNAFMAKSGTQADVQKRDEQTEGQTDKKTQRFWPLRRRLNLSPTKLGMVIEDLEHVLTHPRILGIPCIVAPLWGAENSGTPDPLNLKPS